MRVFRWVIVLALVGGGAGAGCGPADEAPSLPYVADDACPFECCTYGLWVADAPLQAFESPDRTASESFRIGAGERFTVRTGRVVVERTGRARTLRPLTLRQEGYGAEVWVEEGEELAVLDRLGEGYHHVWYRGELFSVELEGGGPEGPWAEIVEPAASTWWVAVERDGATGWLTVESGMVHGNDGCGGSILWSDAALERALVGLAEEWGEAPSAFARRRVASLDLDSDLKDEALVLLEGPTWCGTGGCTLLVLSPDGAGELRLVSDIGLVQTPITVSEHQSQGFRDLVLDVYGGGARPATVVLSYDGEGYPTNPSVLEPVPEGRAIRGIVLFE